MTSHRAMVTSTGSGLAFLDWPLSDGELLPARSYETLAGFFEHFHRVVLDDAHVGKPHGGDAIQEAAHARRVYFDTEVIAPGMGSGDLRGGIAHAEPDLQHLGRRAPEYPVEF